MENEVLLWVLFNVLVVTLLVLDLGVFHRKAHVVQIKEALLWSVFWVSLALLFSFLVYRMRGQNAALEFLAGYLIEESLSVDNLFVFLLIFTYFRVPPLYQHRILFWGILGAVVMRAIFIFAGVALIHHFHWVIYLFGAFLVLTGVKMAFQKDEKMDPNNNPVLKVFRKWMPMTDRIEGGRFFIKIDGKRYATPLFVVLLVVETTDVIFAVDSIPAILSITVDPFIVYTSNVFAILGLRALYFALAGMMRLFHYLHQGLSFILTFVGVKMLISDVYKIPVGIALGVVAGILVVSVIASLLRPRSMEETPAAANSVMPLKGPEKNG